MSEDHFFCTECDFDEGTVAYLERDIDMTCPECGGPVTLGDRPRVTR